MHTYKAYSITCVLAGELILFADLVELALEP